MFRARETEAKDLLRLATREDKRADSTPEVVGLAAARAKPMPTTAVLNGEHVQGADQASDSFHGHDDPFP